MQFRRIAPGVRALRLMVLATCAALLIGCMSEARRFVPGKATDGEVRAELGAPTEQRTTDSGERVWYYSWLPSGRQIYVARFGADGVLRSYEPSLTTQTIERLRPGTTDTRAARELLGPPWQVSRFERLTRDVWEYPIELHGLPYLLVLQFDYDGVLRESITISELPNDNVFFQMRRW